MALVMACALLIYKSVDWLPAGRGFSVLFEVFGRALDARKDVDVQNNTRKDAANITNPRTNHIEHVVYEVGDIAG